MTIIPRGLKYTGFFDDCDVETLAIQLNHLIVRKHDYFSIATHSSCDSVIDCNWHLSTENEFVLEECEETGLYSLFQEMRTRSWTKVKVEIRHGLRIRPSGLPYFGDQNHEFFRLILEREEGMCEVQCRLRETTLTETFLKEMVDALKLSDRPKKHSRNVPAWLETKLLCDSMHLCNVCRQEGVIIHHIDGVEGGGKTEEANLIVLCLTHHRQVHTKSLLSKNLRPEHLREYKVRHAQWTAGQGTNTPIGTPTDADVRIAEGISLQDYKTAPTK